MPLKLSDKLPAIDILKQENIFVIGEARAQGQDIRPLRIVILKSRQRPILFACFRTHLCRSRLFLCG